MVVERDLAGYGAQPPETPWPAAIRVVVSLAVHYGEGGEASISDGDPHGEALGEGMLIEAGHHEFAIESFYEYGARCGIWRLLRTLGEFGVKATFFCAGQALRRNAAVARSMLEGGHEIACCGERYRSANELDEAGQRREIADGLASVAAICGTMPVGWCSRSPSPITRDLLIEHGGILYDSDSYDDDLPHWAVPRRLLTVPSSVEVSDAKFWPLPNNSGFTSPASFLHTLEDNLEALRGETPVRTRILPVELHPRISGRPAKAEQLHQFLARATAYDDVLFETRRDIALQWMGHADA